MGCGIARFGRRGLKKPKLENLDSGFCTQGPRMAARRDLEWRRRDLKWQCTVRPSPSWLAFKGTYAHTNCF